jgi:thioredoxin-related protein
MKKIHYLGLLVIAAFGLMAVSLLAGSEGEVPSKETDKPDKIEWLAFDEGMAALEADTTEKHMFVDITASWCGWCKKMDRETFSDPEVISMIQENFIPVKLWGDSKNELDIDGYHISEQALAKSEFNASGFPTFWFISPERAKIGPLSGYQDAKRMKKALVWVVDREYQAQDDSSGNGGEKK